MLGFRGIGAVVVGGCSFFAISSLDLKIVDNLSLPFLLCYKKSHFNKWLIMIF